MALRTFEVLVTIHCTIMLSSVCLVPFNSNPGFIFWVCWFSLMNKRSKVSDDTCRIVEENFSSNKFSLMFQIISFKPFGLSFKVITFVLLSLILFAFIARLCGIVSINHMFLWCLSIGIRSWFHYVWFKLIVLQILKN